MAVVQYLALLKAEWETWVGGSSVLRNDRQHARSLTHCASHSDVAKLTVDGIDSRSRFHHLFP